MFVGSIGYLYLILRLLIHSLTLKRKKADYNKRITQRQIENIAIMSELNKILYYHDEGDKHDKV